MGKRRGLNGRQKGTSEIIQYAMAEKLEKKAVKMPNSCDLFLKEESVLF